MRAGKVFRIDLDGKVTIVAEVSTRPFGLGFLPGGSLLVASMTQRLILKFGAEKPTIHADLSGIASGYLRDLVVARNGNAYVTSFDANASGPDCFASARVLLATPDGNIRSVADGIAHPNGLAITSAHDLLVAETLGNLASRVQDRQRRNIAASKVFANFEGMRPLGLCEDSEGAVWVAAARQPLFVRVQRGGRVTHRVHVPGRHAVACQLGGQDGRTLFCITIAANLDDYPNRQQTAPRRDNGS